MSIPAVRRTCLLLLLGWVGWCLMAQQPPAHPELPSEPGPIVFENLIGRSGITFKMNNGVTPRKHQVEAMLAGVAVFDYNNDGLMDLYFVNGAHLPDMDKSDPSFWNRLYRNNGDGTFTDVTEKAGVRGTGFGMGVAAADYDNDGWVDLYVTGVNHNQLFHNNGDGTFSDVTEKAGVAAIHRQRRARPGRSPRAGLTMTTTASWISSLPTTSIGHCRMSRCVSPGKSLLIVPQMLTLANQICCFTIMATERSRMCRFAPGSIRLSVRAWGSRSRTMTVTVL